MKNLVNSLEEQAPPASKREKKRQIPPKSPAVVPANEPVIAALVIGDSEPGANSVGSKPDANLLVPRLLAIAKIVLQEPFSNLLPIDPATKASVTADMAENGYNPAYPVHIWDKEGVLVLVDGHTRVTAADENGVLEVFAFVHHFADQLAALDFAVKEQINRRHLKDADMLSLVETYDTKLEPGASQVRENGQFGPKASGDAIGKSAARTAAKLGSSTTKIERARRILAYPNPQIRQFIIDGVLSINAALQRMREEEAEKKVVAEEPDAQTQSEDVPALDGAADGEEEGDKPVNVPKLATQARTKPKPDYAPFDRENTPSFMGACWKPIMIAEAGVKVPKGTIKRPVYVLDEDKLEIDPKSRVIKKPGKFFTNPRVLVSPELDLFASGVGPDKIREIIKAASSALCLEFYFTTTQPQDLLEYAWPDNAVVGAVVCDQKSVDVTESAFDDLKARKWFSIEQLTAELKFSTLNDIDWIVVRAPKHVANAGHQQAAVKALLQQAWAANCPVHFENGVDFTPTELPRPKTKVVQETVATEKQSPDEIAATIGEKEAVHE